jgi:protein-tyrosine phosphatase
MKGKLILLLILISVQSGYAQVDDSSRRKVPLEGAINFRDIGGYPTRDGRAVKWGRLFRSAELKNLSPADLKSLDILRIARVIDFRGPFEASKAPDRIPEHATRISLPAGSERVGDSTYMQSLLAFPNPDSAMIQFYRDTRPFAARYRPMFDALLALPADSALVFHCSAGKDRTGIAAALILYALGVDERIIMADYLASNVYRRNENLRSSAIMAKFMHVDENYALTLMSVKEYYMQSTLRAIRDQYGSMDGFLVTAMGLTAEKRSRLQEKYLTR